MANLEERIRAIVREELGQGSDGEGEHQGSLAFADRLDSLDEQVQELRKDFQAILKQGES